MNEATTSMERPIVHQIWHGKSEELGKTFKWIDCIITDPPFGVDNQSNSATTEHGRKQARKIANDESPEVAIATFKRVFDVLLTKMTANSDIFIFTSHQVLEEWLVWTRQYFAPWGYERKAVMIWEKDGPGQGDLNLPYGMGVEFIMHYRRGTRELSAKRRNAVLHYPQVRPDKLIHPHEKPEALLQDLAKAGSNPGDFIVDPFGGSGSLVRAMRALGNRSAVSIEYDKYNYDQSMRAFTENEGMF